MPPFNQLRQIIEGISPLSDSAWEILASICEELTFQKGDYLLKEEAVCEHIWFLNAGCCKASLDKEGKEFNLDFFFEGDFFTHVASLSRSSPSDYSLIAIEKGIAIRIPKVDLLQAYSSSHEIEAFGRKFLQKLLSEQEQRATDLRVLSPTERYEKLLQREPALLQRVSLTQLASYLGISRETLSRIRAK
ncbi:MAG: cyclic nucleotide-binding domain-containing protein [Bacteroidetes bacterium]|nr:cyclic nucleotide-binding domain-containing protein [Bacteroidota bacterium]